MLLEGGSKIWFLVLRMLVPRSFNLYGIQQGRPM
jgi:hypothetical protein